MIVNNTHDIHFFEHEQDEFIHTRTFGAQRMDATDRKQSLERRLAACQRRFVDC